LPQLPGQATGCTIRIAQICDASTVRSIDEKSSGLAGSWLESAPPDELESGIQKGDVLVAQIDNRIVGYVHLDRDGQDYFYLSGIVVIDGMRGLGVGGSLLDASLASLRKARLPLCTVTSPFNVAMLKLLFGHGFVGWCALPNFFGRGRHRIGLQLQEPGNMVDESTISWHKSGGLTAWSKIFSAGHVVVSLRLHKAIPLLGHAALDAIELPIRGRLAARSGSI
jgi:hypothetical protein